MADEYIKRADILAEAKRLSGPMTGDGWDNLGVYALIERQPSADVAPVVWLPLTFDGFRSNIPYEYDGRWIIVTDGKSISVERIKKDVYDRFYPDGRWFELEDVVAWMPLPKHYKEESDG